MSRAFRISTDGARASDGTSLRRLHAVVKALRTESAVRLDCTAIAQVRVIVDAFERLPPERRPRVLGGVEAETLLSVANEVLEMYCAAEYHDERGNLDERRGS
jgi:hypothetical protein